MHRAESNHAFAVTLSTANVVILSFTKSENVSHVMRAAKNSASLMWTLPILRMGVGAIFCHASHEICQNSPEKSLWLLCGRPKCKTPAIPNDPDASLDNQCSLSGNRSKTNLNEALGFFAIIRRHYFKSKIIRVTSSLCFRGYRSFPPCDTRRASQVDVKNCLNTLKTMLTHIWRPKIFCKSRIGIRPLFFTDNINREKNTTNLRECFSVTATSLFFKLISKPR